MKKITANPLKMLFTVSGGSEANETAIKLTRKMKGKRGGYRLISRLGAYHGATIGATSITGVPSAHFPHEAPLMQGVVFVPMPYCYRCCLGHSYPRCSLECATIIEEYIESLGPETFAGVILEPINCASGVIVPPDGYIKRIKKLCTKFDLILIFDEVVTGFGRTGKMFAYEHYGVTPDILTLGKGMSSGYAAIGGIMVSEEIGRMGFSPYVHGFTMTGSPLANAVALANIQTILDEGLVENAAAMGQYFIKGLSELKEEFDVIGDIRGKGLLLFIEVVKDRETKQSNSALAKNIQRHSLHNGLWFLPIARPRVSGLLFTPALCIQREHIDRGLEILRGAFLKEMHG